ncbi:phosphosulfolactate synthase [Alicyclobacillus fastidiosus]|uniref:Phosphosulfolactate synthase n=1 Tax=Alicyclobacillus fastidiosus TaxID=392011 RepID=A0ABY6ZNS4_9BACL|nr:phosphosulfolactate synthase [Alicyclobacillus fastidiosus]WAH44499.1 phosphosulfolactate synthase [Alicyclobacillus fastidiosus]GMA64457.1 phosphosulfolactate synthase [Alicyclobacillus fastidiosus]
MHELHLPERLQKPRPTGWTVLIDSGVPLRYFEDAIASAANYIDLVKFGWGTSLISPTMDAKIEVLRSHDIEFYFGGTLFEKFYIQDKVEYYHNYCKQYGCRYVEISNGTVPMSNRQKAEFIQYFASEFQVLSEVGYKDADQSNQLSPNEWLDFIQEDLAAGAFKVITEARESGTSGICQGDGRPRTGVVEGFQSSQVDLTRLIFEAPTKLLQTYFIERFGPNVNLANVPINDVISLETLRLGLRSDTFLQFEAH